MNEKIFNSYNLRDVISTYRERLNEKIDKLDITDSTDIISLTETLKQHATIVPIEILQPRPSGPIETTRDIKDDFGRHYKQKVFEIYVEIPFIGNRELFFSRPSGGGVYVFLDKNVSIHSDHISANITMTKLDPSIYKSEISKILAELTANLPQILIEINAWNKELESFIHIELERRKSIVAQKHNFMEQIGLKVNPSSDEYLIPNPVVKKQIPKPVSEATSDDQKEMIHILQENVYRDIKEVIFHVGSAIERKPSLYIHKYEEDLRDMFLLFLETRYESTTGVGEAFNKNGKTDILLKYAKDGSNLFVAECKFWKGRKIFLEAIDQLFGYLTHRDSRTALIIFVDRKELSSIIETAKAEIQIHSQFRKHICDNYNTSISYEMTLPDDSKKTIQMEIMFFHFPK